MARRQYRRRERFRRGNVLSGNGFTGIRIFGTLATGNVVLGNRIGTNPSGTSALANLYDGIFVNGAPGNTIGGTDPGSGNLVSGNGEVGIQLFGSSATGNLVEGNFVGTDVQGERPIPNGLDGIFINNAPANQIGGTNPGALNLISGNRSVGLQLFNRGTTRNVVQGNLIGTDINRRPRLGNNYGLFLNRVTGNQIGGLTAAERNLIAGNRIANIVQVSPLNPGGSRVKAGCLRFL